MNVEYRLEHQSHITTNMQTLGARRVELYDFSMLMEILGLGWTLYWFSLNVSNYYQFCYQFIRMRRAYPSLELVVPTIPKDYWPYNWWRVVSHALGIIVHLLPLLLFK